MVAAVTTFVKIGGLVLVVVWAFAVAEPLGVDFTDRVPPVIGAHWIGIGAASLLAFFAFVEFEDMANVAEEVKEPVSTMPKAIILTPIVATILCIATTTAVFVAVPLGFLAETAAPLTSVFQNAPVGVQQTFAITAIFANVNGAGLMAETKSENFLFQ